MVYLTHYVEYPIYEAAEGGYYYSGNDVAEYERMSLRKAKREMKKFFEEIKNDPEYSDWVISNPRYAYRKTKYIGEGESYVIERKLGSRKRGYEPYC